MNSKCVALAIIAAAIMTFSCIPAQQNDAEGATQDYAATFSLGWQDVDDLVTEITGKTIEEILKDISAESSYELDFKPTAELNVAIERSIMDVNNDTRIVLDRVTMCLETLFVVTLEGDFPAAGTYYAEEGESYTDFYTRVMQTGGTGTISEKTVVLTANLFADVEIASEINMKTGELEEIAFDAKLFMLNYESSDFNTEDVNDEEGNPVSMTISYEEKEKMGNFYANLVMGLGIEGLVVNGGVEYQKEIRVTEHMYNLYVSADLANTLWTKIASMMGAESVKSAIPELLINILESSDKLMDLLQTIKSLTGSSISDITFKTNAEVSDYTDEKGYEYTDVKMGKDKSFDLHIPRGGYVLNVVHLVDQIPDSILPVGVKIAIGGGLALLGYDKIEVGESTPETKQKCEDIQNYVDEIIKYDEEFEFKMPLAYLAIAIVGIIASIAAIIVLRRRV